MTSTSTAPSNYAELVGWLQARGTRRPCAYYSVDGGAKIVLTFAYARSGLIVFTAPCHAAPIAFDIPREAVTFDAEGLAVTRLTPMGELVHRLDYLP